MSMQSPMFVNPTARQTPLVGGVAQASEPVQGDTPAADRGRRRKPVQRFGTGLAPTELLTCDQPQPGQKRHADRGQDQHRGIEPDRGPGALGIHS